MDHVQQRGHTGGDRPDENPADAALGVFTIRAVAERSRTRTPSVLGGSVGAWQDLGVTEAIRILPAGAQTPDPVGPLSHPPRCEVAARRPCAQVVGRRPAVWHSVLVHAVHVHAVQGRRRRWTSDSGPRGIQRPSRVGDGGGRSPGSR